MQSKNKKPPTAAERAHIERLKEQPCACCDDARFGVEIHEIKQGQWFTSIPLCESCHRGPLLGLHGQRGAWRVRKMDEVDALAVAVRRLMEAH